VAKILTLAIVCISRRRQPLRKSSCHKSASSRQLIFVSPGRRKLISERDERWLKGPLPVIPLENTRGNNLPIEIASSARQQPAVSGIERLAALGKSIAVLPSQFGVG